MVYNEGMKKRVSVVSTYSPPKAELSVRQQAAKSEISKNPTAYIIILWGG